MTETDGMLWPMGGLTGVYGGNVRVIDPDFDSMRAALDKVQRQIDTVRDMIDMSTFAPVVSTLYDIKREVPIITMSWTARGKEEQE